VVVADVVLFAGPVIVTDEFRQIDWYGRDVRICPIVGAGSTHFVNLAMNSRDADGRMLPSLLRRYAKGIEPEKVALAAYSAGWGLLDQVTRNDEDRARISALMLSDACFGGGKSGYKKFAPEAALGDKLMVVSTAHTTPGTYPSGRESWSMVWDYVQETTGKRPHEVTPREPAPKASGGWWNMGDLYWGDYTVPGSPRNQGNDYTHEGHHYLAPELWQAYLAPYLAGMGIPWLHVGLGVATGVAVGAAASLLKK